MSEPITTEVLFESADEAQRWHDMYRSCTASNDIHDPCTWADTYVRQYRVRARSLEKHEREIAWYGERLVKLRAELERVESFLEKEGYDVEPIKAVLDADDNSDADGSAF